MAVSTEELRRCVRVSQQVKALAQASVDVSLLSFNAMLAAERAGTSALGFGEVSRHMGHMTEHLNQALGRIQAQVGEMVSVVSASTRAGRTVELLAEAARDPAAARLLAPARAAAARELARLEERRADLDTRLGVDLGDAWRASQMGCALSRSSRIEASHAGAHSTHLTAISDGFGQDSDTIYSLVGELREVVGSVR